MDEEPSKGPSHNNPKEAANYVRSVNSLLKSFVRSICGFNHHKRLDAWETFLHTLSQLLSKLDSAYFIKMDTEVILDTIPDKACDAFLAHPEEAATRIQQHVSSDEIPAGPEVYPRCAYKEIYHALIRSDNKLSPGYSATFKTPTTTWQREQNQSST